MDLFLSLKYGAIPYNSLGFTAIWKFEICAQFEQKLWFIQNVYHIYFKKLRFWLTLIFMKQCVLTFGKLVKHVYLYLSWDYKGYSHKKLYWYLYMSKW